MLPDRIRFVRVRCEHLFVHTEEQADRVFRLLAAGTKSSEISRLTAVSQRTIQRWVATGRPNRVLPDPEDLLRPTSRLAYAYLLGLYLGDGCLVGVHRRVFRFQLTLDARYPAIVRAACDAVRAVLPSNKVRASHRTNAIDVTCYSKLWPVLFPQHGTGKKHERDVSLVAWQRKLTTAHPRGTSQGADPFGRLSLHRPARDQRTGIHVRSLLIQEPIRGHTANLLYASEPDRDRMDTF
jgi:hypothetical protein